MDIELTNKITPVLPVIEFDCIVGGRELTATITHTEESVVEMLYHITFSDGHQDKYASGDDGHDEEFGRTRELDAYEQAIYEDLCVVPGLEEGGGYSYIRVKATKNGSSFNVWIRPREEKNTYNVYYKGEYQFSLRKTDKWEMTSQRGKGYIIDKELAKLITESLDQHRH